MTAELKILTRNETTALPRLLRLLLRQGCLLKKLTLQPIEGDRFLEIFLLLDCPETPLRVIRLLQKQILVLEVQLLKEEIIPAV